MGSTPNLFRNGAVGFIVWLDRLLSTRTDVLRIALQIKSVENPRGFCRLIFRNDQTNRHGTDKIQMGILVQQGTRDAVRLQSGTGNLRRAGRIKIAQSNHTMV